MAIRVALPCPAPSRRARITAWLAPSLVAACAGALVAGLGDGLTGGALHVVAAAGFLGLVAIPALLAAGVIARGLLAAWRPRDVLARLVDEAGAAPRLAGWIWTLWAGVLVLAWAVYRGTWWLASITTFKPLVIGFATPALTVATALGLVALSRPTARLLARLAERLDARWRRAGHATLLRPRTILAAAAIAAVAVAAATWQLAVRPRLGPLDTSVAYAPIAGVIAAVLVHVAWPRLRGRRALGGAVVALALVAVALAGVVRATRPSMALEVWGDRPLTGLAIERLFDLQAIRADIDLSAFRPVDRPDAAHPDVVLITIDTLRADRTPPYGGHAAMPALAALGARGAVFTWAYAPSNVTRRSIPSMLIGAAPNRIRGRVVGWALRFDPRHVLLAERLRAGGYETAGFMCCKGLWGPAARTGWERGLEHLEIEMDGRKLAAAARRWLDAREARADRRPVFLWMHVIEPHNWAKGFGEPRDDATRERLYARALAASDAMLGEVLGAFAHRSPGQAPIVVVSADHGEALGDHGAPYHSTNLYNEQIRVPLVIAGPGIAARPIAETVSLTDLVPTLMELAGFQPPSDASMDGRSLADLATGRRASEPDGGDAFAAMIKDRSNPGGVLAVIKGRWKLIATGERRELYDVHADPGELTNLAAQHPTIVAELVALLAARKAAAHRSPF